MKKTLYLVRHGQTVFNVRRKIQGWCDSPLTELGRAQAGVAAEYFRSRGITFDHAYSSTSERACDTLEILTPMPLSPTATFSRASAARARWRFASGCPTR